VPCIMTRMTLEKGHRIALVLRSVYPDVPIEVVEPEIPGWLALYPTQFIEFPYLNFSAFELRTLDMTLSVMNVSWPTKSCKGYINLRVRDLVGDVFYYSLYFEPRVPDAPEVSVFERLLMDEILPGVPSSVFGVGSESRSAPSPYPALQQLFPHLPHLTIAPQWPHQSQR
jgi:hypothetical protein